MFINSMLSSLSEFFHTGLTYEKKKSSHYQSELEQYIISKNPQSVCDVEHWTQEFDRKIYKKVGHWIV